MAIFQKSVIQKYLKGLNTVWLNTAYDKFNENFSSKKIEKIKNLKEEEYQDGFLRDLFVEVLGYTLKPDDDFNLVREFKNQTNSKKADGAILKDEKAVAVIELKSTKTKDLTSITSQAFDYKNNQPGCKYVITSNFQKLRFYVDYSNEYEEFDLFNLKKSDFELLYLILRKKSIFADTPQKLKDETKFHEEKISKQLYNDYSNFKNNIFENLIKNNPEINKLTLFKKSQKLLDRLLFIFFAEDCGLLPPNSISRIIERYERLIKDDYKQPLYNIYKQYFGYMNIGRKGTTSADDIPAYNGGLFAPDELLDSFIIDDKILKADCLKMSAYDFNTEVDVNILGQIFEHSLNEIEEMEQKISQSPTPSETLTTKPKISKRKKDGVFYTPKYITQYIVENTIGTLCTEKRKEMNIYEIEFDNSYRTKKGLNEKGKQLYKKLNAYKKWLETLKILDPACGSGAFLNQALIFLIAEHKLIDDLIADLTKQKIRLFDTDKSILENNLFGVDINNESVEIAKLSLWLRTAQKGRKLSTLNNNIKCGNSLIDDPEVAGDKAFDWHKEFSQIFNPQKENALIKKQIIEKPDYFDLIEKNAKLAQEKAKQSIKLSKEALEYTSKVYEYTQKQRLSTTKEPEVKYITKNKVGFDVIIGNPPYVSANNMSFSDRKYFNNTPDYKTLKGKWDLYIPFVEKSLFLLKQNGFLGFIIPYGLLNQPFGIKLRQNILNNNTLYSIVDLHDSKVFKAATVPSCIPIIRKGTNTIKNEVDIFSLKIEEMQCDFSIPIEKYKTAEQNMFRTENIMFFENIINKVKTVEKGTLLGDVVYISTGAEIHGKEKRDENGKLISGHSKFDVLFKDYKPEYKPYIEGSAIEKSKKGRYSYPKIDYYLNYQPEIMRSAKFPELFENEKIIIRMMSGKFGIIATYDTRFLFTSHNNILIKKNENDDSVYTNISLKYILSLISSKLINFYYANTYGGFIIVYPKNLKKIPIKKISEKDQQPFIERTDLMLSLNKELQTKKNNFLKTLQEEKSIEKLSKKLQNFQKLEYDIFKKELHKKKVKINLGAENNEWREYFNTSKQKINELQSQINQTDKEIDKMVYELYELTDEEIKIVENSL